MTIILNTLSDSRLIELLRNGSVGVMPTDTVYGLVCSAANAEAVERLYQIKSREHKPGTIIASNIDQIAGLGIKLRYLKAVEQFWPNPISIIIPVSDPGLQYLHQGKLSLACRIVKAPSELLNVLSITGALLTSSANQPGETPANTTAEAQQYFGDKIDFYVDGGDLSGQKPSTLIRIVDDAVEVLRQGAVIVKETGEIIG